jgi:hypothetical protein
MRQLNESNVRDLVAYPPYPNLDMLIFYFLYLH